MWSEGFHRRRNQRAPGIVGGLETAFFDFPVSFTNIVLHFLRKSFQFLEIGLDGVGKIFEFERKQIRVGEMHYSRAAGLRERAAVDKVRVAEMGVPVEIVVDGVVDAAAIFAAKTDIQRSDAVVLEKSGEVRAGTESGDSQISALANFLALFGALGIGDFAKLLALPRS